MWDLVIGYNGLGRVLGGGGGPGGSRAGQGASFAGTAGWGRLFNDVVGGQISWLLPFAAIALVAGVAMSWKRPRTDLPRAALVLWGGWLVVHFTVFSLADGTMHPYYTTALAPAIAALTGIGAVVLLRRVPPRGRWGWVLVAGLAATGIWSFFLLRRTPGWHPWLAWTVAALSAGAVLAAAVPLAGAVRGGKRSGGASSSPLTGASPLSGSSPLSEASPLAGAS